MPTDTLCLTHQSSPGQGHHCSTCARIRVERKIVRATAEALLTAGYFISVDDGEEITLYDSQNITKIMRALFTTDEDTLRVSRTAVKGQDVWDSFVSFIYGNSGFDVVYDYGMKLEPIMSKILAYANELEVKANG